MGTVLVLLLGWLLGLLSPAIVDAIRGAREATRGRKAIRLELAELSRVLVFAAFLAQKAAGRIDRSFLEWLCRHLEQDTSCEAQSLLTAVRAGMGATDEEIAIGAEQMATPAGSVTALQHYSAPMLDSRVSALWSFDTDYQRKLLAIHKNLALLAAIVDQSREFWRLTFNELSSETYDRVSGNLRQCYANYAERAQIAVDAIAALPPEGGA